jgi:hypothetical protein
MEVTLGTLHIMYCNVWILRAKISKWIRGAECQLGAITSDFPQGPKSLFFTLRHRSPKRFSQISPNLVGVTYISPNIFPAIHDVINYCRSAAIRHFILRASPNELLLTLISKHMVYGLCYNFMCLLFAFHPSFYEVKNRVNASRNEPSKELENGAR